MPTVLAYTSPAIGHLFPMTPLLLELARRGHDVHVRTLSSQVGMLRSLGLKAEPMDPRIEAVTHHDYVHRSPVAALSASVEVFMRRADLDGPDLEAALRSVRPDLVLCDINAWGAASAAHAWGGPWASFSPYIPPITSAGTPPFGPGLPPLGGPLGRIRDGILRPLLVGQVAKKFLPAFQSLRSRHGLPPVADVDAFFRSPPLLLVTTSEPFDYPHGDWEPQVRSVGALPWEPRTTAPAWVEEAGDPFVLVTTSSEYQADEALARAAIEGLAGEPYRVVVTMPAGVQDLGPLPPNVRVEEFVPHGAILDHAAVAVTHGGMGGTQKALAAGVPVVVVPWGRDQLEVAARVAHAGAGVRVSKRRLTPGVLRDAVRRAAGMREGAGRVAAGYRAAGGAPAAADAVEGLLDAGTGQRPYWAAWPRSSTPRPASTASSPTPNRPSPGSSPAT